MRFAQPPLYQTMLAVLEFGLQEGFEVTQMGAPLANRLLGELRALCSDGRQVQHSALLTDRRGFQCGGLRIHDAASCPSSAS